MANPIAIAAKGKGFKKALRRAQVITSRYGLTSTRMDKTLTRFAGLLDSYGAGATFPITAVALQRNGATVRRLAQQGIEFAIHGYTHIDHSRLTAEEQIARLDQAIAAFETSQVPFRGFRCPYLRWNEGTLTALRHHHFLFDSSQGLTWDVLNGYDTPAYRRVINFYGARQAGDYPALPSFQDGLVRIPYCLPDDEALIDRLQLTGMQAQSEIWLNILEQTHELGELFTLGLHPERIDLLEEPLAATLAQARSLSPAVWVARLDEIAAWWLERTETEVTIIPSTHPNQFEVMVDGTESVTVLARNLVVNNPTVPWFDKYDQVMTKTFTIATTQRPVIGISPQSAKALVDFLRQQGYLIEISEDSRTYPLYLHHSEFKPEDERPLLGRIENGNWPLLRLGRWPNGARSALCVTGDIDALTLWDYSLRFFGN
jgi:peptidoglycan/xylan/chitin deacetylase (PgdA/CDA1 family)